MANSNANAAKLNLKHPKPCKPRCITLVGYLIVIGQSVLIFLVFTYVDSVFYFIYLFFLTLRY